MSPMKTYTSKSTSPVNYTIKVKQTSKNIEKKSEPKKYKIEVKTLKRNQISNNEKIVTELQAKNTKSEIDRVLKKAPNTAVIVQGMNVSPSRTEFLLV